MNIEEIRKNAPDGATHFMYPFYFKKGNKGWGFFHKERWHGYNGSFGYDDIKLLH